MGIKMSRMPIVYLKHHNIIINCITPVYAELTPEKGL